MTYYLPYIGIIAVIAIVAYVIEKRGQNKEAETAAATQDTGSNIFTNLRDKVTRQKQNDLPKKFRAWVAESLTNKKDQALKDWLTSLSEEETAEFTKQLAAFCDDLNLDLAWLVEQQLDKDPKLEKAASEVVISYCLSCQQAAQAQDDFQAFATYQAMLQNPSGKANRALSQKLFTELVQQDMAPAISPEFFLAPEKERQAYIMESIQNAADADRPKFNNILKQVLGIIQEKKEQEESLSDKIFKPLKRARSSEEEQPEPAATPEEGQAAAAAT